MHPKHYSSRSKAWLGALLTTTFSSLETGTLPCHIQPTLWETKTCLWTPHGFLEAFWKVKLNLGFYRVYAVKRCDVTVLKISDELWLTKRWWTYLIKGFSLAIALGWLHSFLLCIPQQTPCSTAENHTVDFVSVLEYSSVILGYFWLGLRQGVFQEGSLSVGLSV